VPNGDSRLRVTVSVTTNAGMPSNALAAVRFAEPRANANAVVDVQGGPTNMTGAFTYTPPPNAQQVTFFVGRQASGVATTVHLVVVDNCNDWPTFVGGGPTAF
jgi:hypothetical protein